MRILTDPDVLPQSEILIALRNAEAMNNLAKLKKEQVLIKSISGDWESKFVELLKKSPKYSKNGPPIVRYYLTMLEKVADLHKIENLWENLMKLPNESIQEIAFSDPGGALTVNSYLTICNLVNASRVVLVKKDFSNVMQIADSLPNRDIQERIKRLSQDFLNLTRVEANFFYKISSSLPPTCIILLAGIYGERRVTSIILEKHLNKMEFGLNVYMDLLKNRSFEDLPLLWQLQFVAVDSEEYPNRWIAKNETN